ncbi:hypothetical protein DVA44_10300 [Leclercia sp. W17]|nr:hypothetical protein DVA44_10300 [Leclercia sp. W17]
MKKIVLCLMILGFSCTSNATQTLNPLEPSELQTYASTICAEHANPELCKRAFFKFMGYVKTNDDYYSFCQKQKESGMTVNLESCNKSRALRDFIDKVSD